jgi:hypothetical protein
MARYVKLGVTRWGHGHHVDGTNEGGTRDEKEAENEGGRVDSNAIGSRSPPTSLPPGLAGLDLYGPQDYVQLLFYGSVLDTAVVL